MSDNLQKTLASSLICVLQETNILGDHDIELKVGVHVEEDQKPSFIDLVKTGVIKCSNLGVGVIQRNVCNGCSSCGKDLICLDRQLELVFNVMEKRDLCYNCHAKTQNTPEKRKRGRPRKKLRLSVEPNGNTQSIDIPEKGQTLQGTSDLPSKDETLDGSSNMPPKSEVLLVPSSLSEKVETPHRSPDMPEKDNALQKSYDALSSLDHLVLMPKVVLTRISDVDRKRFERPKLQTPGPPPENVSTPNVASSLKSDTVPRGDAASFSPPGPCSAPPSTIRRSARTTKSRFRRNFVVKNEMTQESSENLDTGNQAKPSAHSPKGSMKTENLVDTNRADQSATSLNISGKAVNVDVANLAEYSALSGKTVNVDVANLEEPSALSGKAVNVDVANLAEPSALSGKAVNVDVANLAEPSALSGKAVNVDVANLAESSALNGKAVNVDVANLTEPSALSGKAVNVDVANLTALTPKVSSQSGNLDDANKDTDLSSSTQKVCDETENLEAANQMDPSAITSKVGGNTNKGLAFSTRKRRGRKPSYKYKHQDSPQALTPLKRKKRSTLDEDILVHFESGDEELLDDSEKDPDFDISTVSEEVGDHEFKTVSDDRSVAPETTILKNTPNEKEVINDKAMSPVQSDRADDETTNSNSKSPNTTKIVVVPVAATPGGSAEVHQEEYACHVCHKSFPLKRYLLRHIKKAGSECVQCDVCAAGFHSEAEVEQHKLAHTGVHPYMCEVCHKSFPNIATANKHVKTHLAPHERPFICLKCGKGFTEQHSLREHEYIHAEHRPYECDQCDSKFAARYLLNAHMKYHSTKKYRCYTCNRTYKVYTSLIEHLHVYKDHYTEDTAEPIQKAPKGPKLLHKRKGKLQEEKKRRTYLKQKIKVEKAMRESVGLKNEDTNIDADANDSATDKADQSNVSHGEFEKESLDLIVCKGEEDGGHPDIDNGQVEESANDATEDTQKTVFATHNVNSIKMKGNHLKYGCKICFRKYLSSVTLEKHYQKYGKVCFPCKQCNAKFHSKEAREQHKLLHDGTNPYECRVCFKSFKCLSSCKKHTSTHLPVSKRPYTCDICGKGYINNNELTYHKWSHNQTGSNKCTICQKLFRTRALLKRHMDSHKGRIYKCDSCDKEYRYPSSLRDHLIKFKHTSQDVVTKSRSEQPLKKSSEKKQDKETMCDVCGLTFDNIISFRAHIKSHMKEETTAQSETLREFAFKKHVERIAAQKERLKASTKKSGLFSCSKCDKKFKLQHSLRRHNIMKHSVCKHQCSVCKKRFFVPSELKRHMIRHEGERTFQCHLCPQAFYHDFGLKRHLKVHIAKEKLAYGCELCGKRFAEACYLREHMMKHTGERPFKCDVCDKGFISNSLLKKHRLCHGPKTHECTVCGKCFSQASSLNTHMQTHDAVKRVYLCDDCGKSFKSKSGLNRHQVKHTGIKKHKCQFPGCERAFFFKAELKVHELCHGDVKPFKCGTCGKSFKFRTSFKNHIQYHSKTKNFKCSICDKEFYLENKYKHHMERHLGQRNLECETCGKCFIRKSDLVYHQKQHKGKFTCPECDKVFSLETRLKSHMKVHEGPDKVKCPRCGIYFRDMLFLQTTHLRECDSRKCCRFCGRKFKRVRYLQSHIGVHTGKRPFECKMCGRAYGKEEYLRAHEKEHEKKKHACNFCDKRFDRKGDLEKHEDYHRKKLRENELVEALKKDLEETSSQRTATQTSAEHSCFLNEVLASEKIKSEEQKEDSLAEATASISEIQECDVQVVQDMSEVQFIQDEMGNYAQVVYLDGNAYIQESALPMVSSEQIILTTIDSSQFQANGGENEIIMVAMIPETQ
ncbi:zinc finger protein 208-like [Haliotis asinina]|uniref:zinc finger protein 208-like n=1 Tax=Haliotis asinina TaxID=109174 RepID=UPI0035321177